jgi:hypothetical protein
MALYLILAYSIDFIIKKYPKDSGKAIIERTFNSATFAGSALLLVGIIFPAVLTAIGSLKPYLLFASFAGLAYSIRALFRW